MNSGESENTNPLPGILANFNMAVVVHRASDTSIISCNDKACDILGLTRQQMVGMDTVDPYWTFVNDQGTPIPHDQYPVSQVLAKGASLGKMIVGIRIPDKKEITWVTVNGYPVRNEKGEITEVVISFVDTSEQKRSELALIDSEERYRGLIEATSDVLWRTDHEGNYKERSMSWERYTGQTFDEYRSGGWIEMVHPDDRLQVTLAWQKANKYRVKYEAKGRMWHNPSQTWRHFEVTGIPLFSRDGQLREWAGFIKDVNDQVEARAAVERASLKALEAERLKSAFLTNMSHEIRTPLNSILGFTELTLRGELSDRHREFLETVKASGRHLLALMNNIIDLSRIEAGAVNHEPHRFEMGELLQRLERHARSVIEQKNKDIDLNLTCPDSLAGSYTGDSFQLERVLSHLLENAIKFTASGSIHFGVRQSELHNTLELFVSDTGKGIAEEMQQQVFNAFTHEDTDDARTFGGTGLGLTIVKKLVELMAGRIRLVSKKGNGSTFTVELPMTGVGPAAHSRLHKTIDHNDMTALVAEDDPGSLEILSRFLEQIGFRVSAVTDGMQALNEARKRAYDVMLFDVRMPSLDGLNLTARLREEGTDTPIFLVSAAAMPEDIKQGYDAGASVYLTKPVDFASLTAAIENFLSTPST